MSAEPDASAVGSPAAGVRAAPAGVWIRCRCRRPSTGALVRNGLVEPQAQRHKRRYRRWQREAPTHLWQLDLVGGIYLADGRECKLLTGIDDHSRFVVIAALLVPGGRAVCEAFTAGMRTYGVPSEVLTDNGKQFTRRFTRSRPAEVLFERVCRENGITARLTKPCTPTTTGKIWRPCRGLWRSAPRSDPAWRPGPMTASLVPRLGRAHTGTTADGDQADAFVHQGFAVVGQQANIAFQPVEPGHRQVGFALWGAGYCQGVDRIGLAVCAGRIARVRHQLGWHSDDDLARGE